MGFAGLLAAITGVMLTKSLYADGRRICSSYGDLGEAYFGGLHGRSVVLMVQRFNQFMVGVVFLVLIGTTLEAAHPMTGVYKAVVWKGVATLAVLPLVHLSKLSHIAWLSYFSIASLAVAVALVISACVHKLKEGKIDEHLHEMHWHKLPASFAIFVFAFSAHGLFPEFEAGMSRPRNFGFVLGGVYFSNLLFKIGFSVTAYFAFGDQTQQVISSNLSEHQRIVISLCIALNAALTYPLVLEVFFRSFERNNHRLQQLWPRAIFRSLTVLGGGVVAISLPNFAVAMGFAGSGSQMLLTFIFPGMLYALARRRAQCGCVNFEP